MVLMDAASWRAPVALLLTAVLLWCARQANATEYVNAVNHDLGQVTGISINSETWQSFIVPRDGPVGRVLVRVGALYYGFTATVKFREGAGGAVLDQAVVNVGGLENNDPTPRIAFHMNSRPMVKAGQTYSFSISCSGSCGVAFAMDNSYPDGQVQTRSGRKNDDFDFAIDYVFDACSEPVYAPSPGTCTFLTVCPPGQYVSKPHSKSSDRECDGCNSGTYTSSQNEDTCHTPTPCNFDEYETQQPTLTTDRVCTEATTCDSETEYRTVAHTYTSDAECESLTMCGGHQYQIVRPTLTTDRECTDRKQCDHTLQYEFDQGTPTTDRTCANLTQCIVGEYQLVRPTATMDRECSECEPGTFKTIEGPFSCAPCPKCGQDQFEVSPCTPTTERRCVQCTGDCQDGFHNNGTCTESGTRVCERCLTADDCGDNEFLTGRCLAASYEGPTCEACHETCNGCTSGAATACIECTSGYAFHSENSLCVSDCGERMFSSDGVCKPCNEACGEDCVSEDADGCLTCDNAADGVDVTPEESTWLVIEDPVTRAGRCVGECPDNYFLREGSGECRPCTVCRAGHFIKTTCSSTEDAVCESCTLNVNFSDRNDTRACIAVSPCGVGERMATPPTTSSDRVCAPCEPGSFQDQAGEEECKPVTTCKEFEEFASVPATTSTDVQCSTLSNCLATEYESTAPTYTTDRECAPISICQPGTYQADRPTPVSDRVCSSCPPDTYQNEAAAMECKPVRECAEDQFQTRNYTATIDRLCAAVSVCRADEWERVPPTSTSDRECTDAVQYCQMYADNTDQQCRRCVPGYHLTSADTCTPCSVGQACDGLRITPCAAGTYQDESGQTTCKVCPPGTHTSRTGRTVCEPCDGTALQPSPEATVCVDMKPGHFGIVNETLAAAYAGVFSIGYVGEAPCEAGSQCQDGVSDMCAPGKYSAASAAIECGVCGPANYSLNAGSTRCLPIPQGWYGDGPAANVWSQIRACPEGSYCSGGVRRPCPKGTYQDEERQSTCKACSATSYNPTEGSSSSEACLDITLGFYGLEHATGGGFYDQAPCEPGAHCVAGRRYKCTTGTYQPLAAQTACLTCEAACSVGEVVDADVVCDPTSGVVACVDIQPPAIAISGSNTTRIPYGGRFIDPGAECTDTRDGSFRATRVTDVPATLGTHQLLYRCTDTAGLSVEGTRTLVVFDAEPPVISLLGSATMKLVQFDDFDDPGANATDNADPAVAVAVSGSVDVSKAGTYELRYTATDGSGNAATPVVRSVVVLDLDTETQAQTLANEAYSESLDRTGSEELAQRAARQAYIEANGGQDLDVVIEAAKSHHSSQSASSSSSGSISSVTVIAIGVAAAVVVLAVVVVIFVLRSNNKEARVTSLSTPYVNPAFEASAGTGNYATGPLMVNTADFIKHEQQQQQQQQQAQQRDGPRSLPPPPDYQPNDTSVYYSSVDDSASDYAYADPSVARRVGFAGSSGYGFSDSGSTATAKPQAGIDTDESYETPVASMKRRQVSLAPRKASATLQDVTSNPEMQVYGSSEPVDLPVKYEDGHVYAAGASGQQHDDDSDDGKDDDDGDDAFGGFNEEDGEPDGASSSGHNNLQLISGSPDEEEPVQMGEYDTTPGDNNYDVATVLMAQSDNGQTDRTPEERRELVSKTMSDWFKPSLARTEAGAMLKGKPSGTFVVRKSSRAGSYAISVKAEGTKVWNGLIGPCDEGYTFNNRSRVFATVTDVIVYCLNEAHAEAMGLPLALAAPTEDPEC